MSEHSKRLRLSSSPTEVGSFNCKMSSDSSPPLTHSITLSCQPAQPVQIVAAPHISDPDFRSAIDSSLFQQWLKNTQSENGFLHGGSMSLTRVLIQGVDMFGKHIGFLKFQADVFDKQTGIKVPGIVFARGPAAAVLILLESEDKTYAVLTEQARIPVGRFILELPAGMLDVDNGDFLGAAIREVEEETGIHLKQDHMVNLTSFLDQSTGCRIFPSPGGCDEEIGLFLYRGKVGKEIIEQLQGKETGLREHGELIKVHVVPYERLWCMTADAKVLAAIALYEMSKREGILPPLET
ncbi:putative ADP-sugar diphosphatase [Rosa chinensis]|uniref:Putative ADP-sugar diphosphatase n=1 Tax=Rosa chinensis TaxID=74649 RepID=A0A2P6PPD5_ROSCH|nr:nudix hydrolase 14, chloroplastic [Rosa chinensis]PRQ23784.1 putative ADP-sugar diphosphatase [Rosa chinensis]